MNNQMQFPCWCVLEDAHMGSFTAYLYPTRESYERDIAEDSVYGGFNYHSAVEQAISVQHAWVYEVNYRGDVVAVLYEPF